MILSRHGQQQNGPCYEETLRCDGGLVCTKLFAPVILPHGKVKQKHPAFSSLSLCCRQPVAHLWKVARSFPLLFLSVLPLTSLIWPVTRISSHLCSVCLACPVKPSPKWIPITLCQKDVTPPPPTSLSLGCMLTESHGGGGAQECENSSFGSADSLIWGVTH